MRRRSRRRRAWACSETDHPNRPFRGDGRRERCGAGRRRAIVALMDNDISQVEPSAGSAAWARAFAVVYDPFLWVGERAGVRAHRQELLSGARGRTVEIGSGTGLNLPHYPDDLDELVLIEPDAAMRSRLGKSMRRSSRRARLVDAAGGALAVRRRIGRHGRLDLRLVHRRRSRSRPAGDRAGVAPRRPAALHRARPFRVAHARPLAGSPGRAVVSLRERLSLQSGDCGADRDLRVRARPRTRRVMARHAAHRATAHRRPRPQGRHDDRDRLTRRRRGVGGEREGRFTDG